MKASANVEVALAQGRRASVRVLLEEETRALWEGTLQLLPAERTTAALRRCLTDHEPDPLDLTVGERDALLLEARSLWAGDALPCVLDCPSCGAALELELSTRELLGTGRSEPASDPALRPVTGADHEWAARRALADVEAAAHELLRRCLRDGEPEATDEELGERLERLDPYAELSLDARCPECGDDFVTVFDPSSYVFAELSQRVARLEDEVHALALGYGWSERDIVALGEARRGRYLDLLDGVGIS